MTTLSHSDATIKLVGAEPSDFPDILPMPADPGHVTAVPRDLDAGLLDAVAAAVPGASPNTPQLLYGCMFRLAQHVKGLPQYADADPADLGEVVAEWQRRTWGAGGWDFAEVMRVWRLAWGDVLHAVGARAFDQLWLQAKSMPPGRYAELQCRPEHVKALAGLCWLLQLRSGPHGPFFLASTTAGRLMGKTQRYGCKVLKKFRDDAYLTEHSNGKGTSRASRYWCPSARAVLVAA